MSGDKREEDKIILRRREDREMMREEWGKAFDRMLDRYALKFGWFAIKTIAVAIGGAIIWLILTTNGWIKQ